MGQRDEGIYNLFISAKPNMEQEACVYATLGGLGQGAGGVVEEAQVSNEPPETPQLPETYP